MPAMADAASMLLFTMNDGICGRKTNVRINKKTVPVVRKSSMKGQSRCDEQMCSINPISCPLTSLLRGLHRCVVVRGRSLMVAENQQGRGLMLHDV